EAVVDPEVFAVASGVLADEVNLADPLLEQARCLRDHRLEAAAAEFAAILRDHAESARMIAAFRNFDVGEMAGPSRCARRLLVVGVGLGRVRGSLYAFAECDHAIKLVGADERIALRNLLGDVAAIPPHQAARHNQLLCTADLLVLGHFENGVDRFYLRGIDEAAGVHDQYIGLVGMRRQLVAFGYKLAHHHFTINEVLGTAKTDKANFQSYVPRSFKRIYLE